MNQFKLFQENIPALFTIFRDRIKFQTKIISKEFSIARNSAYDLLAIMWGFDNWHCMNSFLKLMEEIHISIAKVKCLEATEGEARFLLRKLSPIRKYMDHYLQGNEPICLLPMNGIYQSLKFHLCYDNIHSGADYRNEDSYWSTLRKCLTSYVCLFNKISLLTGSLKDRKFVCSDLADLEYEMYVRFTNSKVIAEKLSIPFGADKVSEGAMGISPKLFGIQYEMPDLDMDSIIALHPMTEVIGNPFGSDRLYELFQESSYITITFKELLSYFGPVDSTSINQSFGLFASIGSCIAHLPNDALVTVTSWSFRRNRHEPMDSSLKLLSISVKHKSHLPALLGCVNFNAISSFDSEKHDGLNVLGIDMTRYANGFTVHTELC